MKELSIEEKALRYNEVIERANSLLSGNQLGNDWIYALLPELKESEDEKIRKAIRTLILSEPDIYEKIGFSQSDCLVWIEKQGDKQKLDGTFVNVDDAREEFMQQVYSILDADATNDRANLIIDAFDNLPSITISNQGEQNLTNSAKTCKDEQKPNTKVEQKFNIGDWVVYGDEDVDLITGLCDKGYEVNDCAYIPFGCEDDMRYWTIQDAKDGDILATDSGRPFVFKGCFDIRYPSSPSAYCGITISDDFRAYNGLNRWTAENVYPATEEQRELLFQKMREAGYEWVSEKGLHKIEDYIQQKPF